MFSVLERLSDLVSEIKKISLSCVHFSYYKISNFYRPLILLHLIYVSNRLNKNSIKFILIQCKILIYRNLKSTFFRRYKSFSLELLKYPSFHQPRQQHLGESKQYFTCNVRWGKSKQYIAHEYILLTDRNDTSGWSFNRCGSLEALLISQVFRVLGGYWIPKR
jgi:hypothetical protein